MQKKKKPEDLLLTWLNTEPQEGRMVFREPSEIRRNLGPELGERYYKDQK